MLILRITIIKEVMIIDTEKEMAIVIMDIQTIGMKTEIESETIEVVLMTDRDQEGMTIMIGVEDSLNFDSLKTKAFS